MFDFEMSLSGLTVLDFGDMLHSVSLEASADGRTIKSVFDSNCTDLKIDSRLIKAIRAFDQGFITKNTDHISFFGSGLLGVYPIKWLDEDRDSWVDDILRVDDIGLEADLHSLDTIDVTRKVTSDMVNLSFIYLAHRIVNSSLTATEKQAGLVSVFRISHYKYLSSLLSHYFQYPADEATAKATYTSLSQKFGIKQAGNWFNLLTRRAEELASNNSIHRDRIKYMRDDAGVLYVVSDIQTRIREVVKAQTAVFYEVRKADGKVISTSKMMQIEEGITIKDVRRDHSRYMRYLSSIISDPTDFVRTDLLKLVSDIMPSANQDVLRVTLNFMVGNYNNKRMAYIQTMTEEIMLYTFQYMFKNKIKTNNFVEIVPKLKAMLTGSRINDDVILKLRDMGDKLVRTAANKKISVQVAAERTAILIYIVLRTLAMDHYK